MSAKYRAQGGQDGRLLLPFAFIVCVTLLVCCRIFVWSAGGWDGSNMVVSQSTATAKAACTQKQQLPSQAIQRAPSEWDYNIIFNGEGKLESCPAKQAWLEDQWTSPDATEGSVLPLSATAQQMIWQHQHPADCSKAKFLLYRNPALGEGSHGVGSLLHLETTMLLLAMNTGRILVEIPGTYITDDPYCTNRTTLHSCYFIPLTNCTVTQEQIDSAMVLIGKEQADRDKLVKNNTLPQFVKTDRMMAMKTTLVHTIPLPFQQMFAPTGIPKANAYYWWRSQAIAYIVRPNAGTLEQLAVRKRDKLRGTPLAPGCVSVYIRHGDKGTEHKTYNDSEYEAALVHLREVDPSLTRQVFLSTEDPATVTFFTNATRNWSTSYVDMPRKPDRKKNNIQYMKEHGFAEEMLDGLLNLDLALQCDGFVSSINSNWARLIDELRSTVRCKAQAVYMDVALRSPKGLYFWY